METNFFGQIADLKLTGNIRLNIQPQENGDLIVSLLLDTSFVKDKAAKLIPPLVLKGSAADLDTGFFNAIAQPVQTTNSLLVNIQAHSNAIEKAQKESRIVKDREETQKKEKESKKKKFDEQMKKVDELEKQKKIGEAIGQLPDLKQFPEFEAEIKKKSQELRSQHGTLSLFAAEPVTETIVNSTDERETNDDDNNDPEDDPDNFDEDETNEYRDDDNDDNDDN